MAAGPPSSQSPVVVAAPTDHCHIFGPIHFTKGISNFFNGTMPGSQVPEAQWQRDTSITTLSTPCHLINRYGKLNTNVLN